jgi:hypothetical protein
MGVRVKQLLESPLNNPYRGVLGYTINKPDVVPQIRS